MPTLIRAAILPLLLVTALAAADGAADQLRATATTAMKEGNWKEAYDGFHRLVTELPGGGQTTAQDLANAVQCLRNLGREDEFDDLVDGVVERYPEDWRVLHQAARNYHSITHWGYLISGEFHRGHHRGGGKRVSAVERDRVRTLQLFDRTVRRVDGTPAERAGLWLEFATVLRQRRAAWELQALTDLETLPDYEETRYWGWHPSNEQGAPVTAEGDPVLYQVPDDWAAAASDGERWRWCLVQAVEAEPKVLGETLYRRARFSQGQFGVNTMGRYGLPLPAEGEEGDDLGPWAVHTLAHDETLARLATGVRRFKLPAEHHHIALYRRVAELGQDHKRDAQQQLANVFENRRQYPTAAEWWQKAGQPQRVDQIRGNWGSFQSRRVDAAGDPAHLDYRFRNGRAVTFTAHRIKVPLLFEDVRRYLRDRKGRVDWNMIDVQNIGQRLVRHNQRRYRGEQVAEWSKELVPLEGHFNRTVTVETPFSDAGAYLVEAAMADGNTSRVVVWLADTALVRKPVAGKAWYYVADARDGKPVADATVSFFGFDVERDRRRIWVEHKEFKRTSDDRGRVVLPAAAVDNSYRWLVVATTEEGRLAYQGFAGVWYPNRSTSSHHVQKGYLISDRPIYRPGDAVHVSGWLRQARYELEGEEGALANATRTVRVNDAKGQKFLEKNVTTDPYGGFQIDLDLPDDAALGAWSVQVMGMNASRSFRVEEYKKPEFEVVVDAPSEPVALGEAFTATIEATYYFGAPVSEGEVHYTVKRSERHGRWYPAMPWDWLYGSGYWWFAPEHHWYPGWHRWGCLAPRPMWQPWHQPQPEIVAEATVPIGEDGTVAVEIDTALAKATMGDRDHNYTITAEVVDQSRRTIVGSGSVVAAREPFDVTVWQERGWLKAGDRLQLRAAATTIDGSPVEASGSAKLLRIEYDDERMPREQEVAAARVKTDAEGRLALDFQVARPGQYRMEVSLTDAKGRTITGAGLVNVLGGDDQDADGFRFNALELIPDRKSYAPGDVARVLVATEQPDTTVLWFARPENGVYGEPEILRIDGRTRLVEVPITRADMPNIFVEAVTVADGEVHTVAKELVVPPADRMLQVEVTPSQGEVLPGAEVELDLRVTDEHGKPVVGPNVLTVYDRAIEYIAGGSNMDDIRAFYWKWRRSHHPRTYDNLSRWFGELLRQGEQGMHNLGIFGHLSAEFAREDKQERRDRGAMRQEKAGGNMMALGAGARAPSASMEVAADADSMVAAEPEGGEAQAGGQDLVQPTVRSNFADSAFWDGRILTDADGRATVTVTMPEDLTTWSVRTWSMGPGTRVGQAQTEVVTTKHLVLRLQAPRFFLETDEVVLSANVHNHLDEAKETTVSIGLDEHLELQGEAERTLTIPAGSESRVDWRVRVAKSGEAVITMQALTDEESDAVERRFPVKRYGAPRMMSRSLAIRGEQDVGVMRFEVPEQRDHGESELVVQVSPTLAASLVEALPYLASYPYGCTEQTLNRFVPTVICQKILTDMDVDLAAVAAHAENLAADTLPDGGHEDWRQWKHNPVFDRDEVDDMARKGVERLADMQVSDGGWGWFSGWGERSYPHTTAVVVHGLRQAKANGAAVPDGLIAQGEAWLRRYQSEQITRLRNAEREPKVEPWKTRADNLDALVFTVLAEGGISDDRMRAYLYRDRNHLAVYSKAMMGLALHLLGDAEQSAMYQRNVEQFLVRDDENQTAWLDLKGAGWWYWYGSETEALAWYLKLLAAKEPKGDTAAAIAKYLLTNRRHATYWDSTRDTALAIEALADFLRESGEGAFEGTLEIVLDGEVVKEVAVTPQNLFTLDGRFTLSGEAITAGEHRVEIRRKGEGACYANAWLEIFDRQESIPAAGLEIKVTRQVYRLERIDAAEHNAGAHGQVLEQAVEKYKRVPLADGDAVTTGDLLEVELSVASKNDYEYLLFEDYKPAGVEPVDLRSGYYADGLRAYRELRDDRVSLFVHRLARGEHSIAYRVRAEVPGTFTALPTQASAMYAPELRGNSASRRIGIEDRAIGADE